MRNILRRSNLFHMLIWAGLIVLPGCKSLSHGHTKPARAVSVTVVNMTPEVINSAFEDALIERTYDALKGIGYTRAPLEKVQFNFVIKVEVNNYKLTDIGSIWANYTYTLEVPRNKHKLWEYQDQ